VGSGVELHPPSIKEAIMSKATRNRIGLFIYSHSIVHRMMAFNMTVPLIPT
jgi:hypothetical protein